MRENGVRVAEGEAAATAFAAAHVEGEGRAAAARHSGKATRHSAHAGKWVAPAWHTAGSATGRGVGGCAAAMQEVFEAELIVDFAFLGVGEELVGLGDFFEFLASGGVVFVLVGVVF